MIKYLVLIDSRINDKETIIRSYWKQHFILLLNMKLIL